MAKQVWKPGNMVYPLPAVIVTCGTNGKYNAITIAWTGTVCTNPAMVYISVRKSRYSYDIIKENQGFVINLTTEELAYATDYCGVKSGKDVDKFKELGLTYEIGEYIKAPLLEKSPVSIECELVEVKELGSHDMFLAKVVQVHADEAYFDENNKFHLEKAKPIAYSHGQYYTLGENIGKFGYAVMKEKTKKKKTITKQSSKKRKSNKEVECKKQQGTGKKSKTRNIKRKHK